jgi:hypothetical protein
MDELFELRVHVPQNEHAYSRPYLPFFILFFSISNLKIGKSAPYEFVNFYSFSRLVM